MENDINIVIGDTEIFEFEILKNGIAFDLTGYSAHFIIANQPDETPLFDITAVNQIDESIPVVIGKVFVKLAPEITATLSGIYWYSLRIFDPNNERKTFKSGYLTADYGAPV